MPITSSPNFAYLAHHDARLVALATQAEEHFAGDPTVTLFKLRQFAEVLVAKHGVSFAEAMRAFEDPNALSAPDTEIEGRFVLIGLSPHLRLLFIVSTDSGDRIRIISARKASPRQRKLYSHGP